MPSSKLWPGQVEKGFFTLEQVRALSSVARAEVFWAFTGAEPRSTNDVAEAIGRAAPTVRYHVNELVKADLLLVAETRKRHSRTEEAYVHKLLWGYTPRPPMDREYLVEVMRGFASIMKAMELERTAALLVSNEDQPFYDNTAFRHAFVRLSPAKMADLRAKLEKVVYEYRDDEDDEGIVVHIVGFMAPVILESRRRYKELAGRDLPGLKDDE